MQLRELIEQAGVIAGSEYKLARELGVAPRTVTDWKAGRRPCTATDRAVMADTAGLDPFEVIADAMLEKMGGKPKEQRLREILMKRLHDADRQTFHKVYFSQRITRQTGGFFHAGIGILRTRRPTVEGWQSSMRAI